MLCCVATLQKHCWSKQQPWQCCVGLQPFRNTVDPSNSRGNVVLDCNPSEALLIQATAVAMLCCTTTLQKHCWSKQQPQCCVVLQPFRSTVDPSNSRGNVVLYCNPSETLLIQATAVAMLCCTATLQKHCWSKQQPWQCCVGLQPFRSTVDPSNSRGNVVLYCNPSETLLIQATAVAMLCCTTTLQKHCWSKQQPLQCCVVLQPFRSTVDPSNSRGNVVLYYNPSEALLIQATAVAMLCCTTTLQKHCWSKQQPWQCCVVLQPFRNTVDPSNSRGNVVLYYNPSETLLIQATAVAMLCCTATLQKHCWSKQQPWQCCVVLQPFRNTVDPSNSRGNVVLYCNPSETLLIQATAVEMLCCTATLQKHCWSKQQPWQCCPSRLCPLMKPLVDMRVPYLNLSRLSPGLRRLNAFDKLQCGQEECIQFVLCVTYTGMCKKNVLAHLIKRLLLLLQVHLFLDFRGST